MKKVVLMSVVALMLLSSCATYTAEGASTGGWFGSVIGSAIGGIAGGPRGSDIGTLVGMAGGAVVGAAVGSAADKAEQKKYEDYQIARQRRAQQADQRRYDDAYSDNSGFDTTNSGDDRLYGFGENFGNSYADAEASANLEIRNAKFVDASHDGVLTRGEEARMVFEIFNHSSRPAFRVQPSVTEVTGNKHIHISENVLVESIAPGKGIRYTASIKADNSLKDGEAVIRIGVLQANKAISSQSKQFTVRTSKR